MSFPGARGWVEEDFKRQNFDADLVEKNKNGDGPPMKKQEI